MEYRSILENTLEDFLTVLSKPDWPAAELLLQAFSALMIERLRSGKSDIYLKSLAIEWLGIMARRVKTGLNMISGSKSYMTPEWICEIHEKLPKEISASTAPESLELLLDSQSKILQSISSFQGNVSVIQFQISLWGHEYSSGWKEVKDGEQQSSTTEMLSMLSAGIRRLWCLSLGIGNVAENETQHQFQFPELTSADVDMLSEVLAARSPLYKSYNIFLSEIMSCLGKDVVTYRNRAVKAMRHIVTSIPEILDEPRTRNAILQRIHDASPSVRDVAVDVLAKYLAYQRDVPRKLYEIASSRVFDTAVNVRKRVVKLLQELFHKCIETDIRVDIAAKLIQRISDSEVGISDLAFKATQEVLFHPFREIERDGNDYFGSSYANAPKARKRRIEELTDIIIGAVARLEPTGGNRTTSLSKITQRIMTECDDKARIWFEKVFQWIIDCLFERMLLYDEQDKVKQFTTCLVTIHAFTTTCPDLLRETQISVLQPYLSITKVSDWYMAHYVLNIYKDVLPRQKYHDPDFIAILERILFDLIGACPQESTASVVSCLCTVVESISQRYNILIRILGSCMVKLRADRDQIGTTGGLARPATGVMKMLLICGLLCQNIDFDAKRREVPLKLAGLDKISEGTIVDLVYDLVLEFTKVQGIPEEAQIRVAALQSLGYLFTRHPTLITKESSMFLIRTIFEQGNDVARTRLMIVFQEFLAAEETRLQKREQDAGQSLYTKQVDVETLLGNTAEFAELGVNGALMQCYLPDILKCAMSDMSDLRLKAFDVITAVVEQGLAHPVLCMPIIVASETSPDQLLRHRAYYVHRLAHDKYGLLLYSHIPKYLTAAYEYQKLHYGDHVNGYGKRDGDAKVDSLLGMTYSVIKQKKKSKLDFLEALVKPFQLELKQGLSDQVHHFFEKINVNYLSFLADCIVTLDLGQSDEVLHLLYYFERIQATSCAELLLYIQSRRADGDRETDEDDTNKMEDIDDETISKAAIAMYILLKMRLLLQELDVLQYDPADKKKPHALIRDQEVDAVVDWREELLYFRRGTLTHAAAAQARSKFENLALKMTADISDRI
ncbi:sister chromatid cohesion C-terminus-domain-containing protein [Dichotomocladium elegans]|nr:sister chromatid cohesion C-terminus-domain-containing protein [Dichotomocladium elegans]